MAEQKVQGQGFGSPSGGISSESASQGATGLKLHASAGDELIAAARCQLLDEGPALCILDPQGQIAYTNRAFDRISKPLAVAGCFPGSLRSSLQESEWPGAATYEAEPLAREICILVNGQQEFYAQQRKEIAGPSGEPAGTAYLFTAATKLKQTTKALEETSARLDDITRLVSDWVWESDKQLLLVFVSPRVTDALGYHPRELIGRSLIELPSAPCPKLQHQLETDPRSPFRDVEIEIVDKQGAKHLFRLSGLPVYSAQNGEFLGLRGTAENVTELRAREQALVSAKEAAELANRAKTEFLANMSHELRTPLNAVIGFSEIMASELLGPLGSEQYKGYASDIHESAEHLLNLINDILDVAKVEAGGHRLSDAAISPYELAESVQRLVVDRARRAGQNLDVNLPPNLPQIRVDERKIKQVLLNLLSNSVKFTPRGGNIELAARREADGSFVFTVSDTGIGIAKEDIARAFSPFEQVDSRLNRQFDGTGLGLPLSLGFMKLHGGTLELDSEPGVGTRAFARLPLERIVDNVSD